MLRGLSLRGLAAASGAALNDGARALPLVDQSRWRRRKLTAKAPPSVPSIGRPSKPYWERLYGAMDRQRAATRAALGPVPEADALQVQGKHWKDCSASEPIELDPSRDMYAAEKPVCILCRHSVDVDYRNGRLLSQFLSSFSGRMYDRHVTGLCEYQHWRVYEAIKLSRRHHLIPTHKKDPRFLKDPALFDPMKPLLKNPH